MTDAEFLKLFETCELPAEHFDHLGHLRLAWLYLNNYALEVAIDKTTRGIARYANSLGAKDKFHYTLTEAIVKIMSVKIQQQKPQRFEVLLADNPDLVTGLTSVLAHHYSEACLYSTRARREFVEPDKSPI